MKPDPIVLPHEGEEWRPVKGWEQFYEVSDLGQVRSKDRVFFRIWSQRRGPHREPYQVRKSGRMLKQALASNGYKTVGLSDLDGGRATRPVCVHRLVAEAFIPNPNNKRQVNHLDGVKTNNAVRNLEWVTAQENGNHSYYVLGNQFLTRRRGSECGSAKLHETDITKIKELLPRFPHGVIAKQFGVHRTLIQLISAGKIWKHVQ